MLTQTHRWPDPVVHEEGVHLPLENRPRKKKVRKYSIIYCVGKLVQTLILAAAFLAIMAAVGNTIEFIARL